MREHHVSRNNRTRAARLLGITRPTIIDLARSMGLLIAASVCTVNRAVTLPCYGHRQGNKLPRLRAELRGSLSGVAERPVVPQIVWADASWSIVDVISFK